MLDAPWRRKERARTTATPRAVDEKLDLALDDVERICVVRVNVGFNTFPAVLERAFDDLQIRQKGKQPKAAVLPVQPLTLIFGYKGGAHSGCIMTYWHKATPFPQLAKLGRLDL
jgi:hypothetical protein